MNLLRQLRVSGRRRVDFYLRKNDQAGDVGMRVSAFVAPKESSVRRDSKVLSEREPKLEVSSGS